MAKIIRKKGDTKPENSPQGETIEPSEDATKNPNETSSSQDDDSSNEDTGIQPDKLEIAEEKYLRLFAEYDNFRKRSQKEKDTRFSDGIAHAMSNIVVVLDNLERVTTLEVSTAEGESISKGVKMVLDQLHEILSGMGIAPIETIGKDFNPELHNAIMHIDDENYGENKIIEEFMKGYLFKDKVIRHSMVKVAN